MKKRETSAQKKQVMAREKKIGISEWSEGERSEPKRNGEIPILKNFQEGRRAIPNSEVLEKPKRRRFSAAYKAQIVQKAEGCKEPGQIGALLRREGLYSSQLTEWRKQYRTSAGLQEKKRGRKPKQSALEKENEKLKKQITHLEERLEKAETIIDIQKKISKLLGIQQLPRGIEEGN